MNIAGREGAFRWCTALVALACLTLLAMPLTTTLAAQSAEYEPLSEGWLFHLQGGYGWSTLHSVEPEVGGMQFERLRGVTYMLRLSRVLAGPIAGFAEAGLAQRGADIAESGEPSLRLRSRWYDAALGLNVAARCVAQLCPSVDAGVLLGFHRESVITNLATGRPVGALDFKSTETAAIVGLRVASARYAGVAAVVRLHEGLTDIPDDGSKARNRSLLLMIGLPLNR